LGVRSVTDAVGDVCVDAADQRVGVGERIAGEEAHRLSPAARASAISGLFGFRRDASASAACRGAPLLVSASSSQSVQSRGSFAIALRKFARALAFWPERT